MDLGARLLTDLDDVTTLYERKLCSMGVLRLALGRTASAARLGHPDWVQPLQALEERAVLLEADGAPWLQGMALVDAVRRFVKQPTPPGRPVLSLVREAPVAEEEGPDDPAEQEPAASSDDAESAPTEPLPDNPIEPAMPSLMPRRKL